MRLSRIILRGGGGSAQWSSVILSLFYRINIGLLVGSVLMVLVLSWPLCIASVAVGVGFGLWLSFLGRRALQLAPVKFVESWTAMDMRRVLYATPPGRLFVRVYCVGFALLIIVGFAAGGAEWQGPVLSGLLALNLIGGGMTHRAIWRRLAEQASSGLPSDNRWREA